MSETGKNNSLLLSDTLVPDLFIYYYLNSLSKEAISVYLWIVSNSSSSMTENEIFDISMIGNALTEQAISELISAGLLAKNIENRFYLVDIKQNEVNSYCASVIARGGANLSDLELSPYKKERDDLCDSISKTIYAGKMGYVFYRIVDNCINDYKFETIVIYTLFDVAKERKIQYDYKAVEKLASEWFKKGIKDQESLDKYLSLDARRKEAVKLVGAITRKRLDKFDLDRIDKWIELGFSNELIEFAFESNSYKSSLKTKDIDDTLTKWVEAGITNLDEAKIFEEEQHKENKRKYSRRKTSGGDSLYRTGEEAGISEGMTNDIDTTVAPEEDSDSYNDILSMFGDGNDENN